MGIHRRGYHVLDDDHHSGPTRPAAAAKQQKMDKPHGYEQDRSKPAELNRDGKDLIVGIYAGDCRGTCFTRRGKTKLLGNGARTVAN